MTDDRLGELIRAGMPPTRDETASHDLWPSVLTRIDGPPRWSLLDVGLAAAVAVSLLLFPDWLWVIAYHL
jgi:hypothetical protein